MSDNNSSPPAHSTDSVPSSDASPGFQTPSDPLLGQMISIARFDEDALHDLYNQLAPQVLGIAQQVLGDSPWAERASVDVFANVWATAADYEPRNGPVAEWVCAIARAHASQLRQRLERGSVDGLELRSRAPSPLITKTDRRSPGEVESSGQ